ncbi:MaoC family dehydratase [Zavarzinia compransoris]|uniref:MaoC family dehydratase n=1 Tax=Zavarzinia marina TaxID=2911065 RepID=UPI001F36B4BB|nr:MaoC family dehydratase [Zavarzinia marina]MCF4164678.1 MaoC family dehydratase [Zavarzinia marina]
MTAAPHVESPSPRDWLEDFVPGTRERLGTISFTAGEIVAFARQFDPQAFHIDAEAAKASPFGGLVASGWHTLAKIMRLVSGRSVAGGGRGFIASPGFEDLRWIKPSRPGDVFEVFAEVISVTPSASKPDRGLIVQRFEAIDAEGATVCSLTGKVFFKRRGDRA